MLKLLRLGWILAFACAALAYPVAGILDATALEGLEINPFSDDDVLVNKTLATLPSKTDPKYRSAVIALYGQPNQESMKVVFFPASRVLRPAEMPELVLLKIRRTQGEDALQMKLIYYLTPYVLGGAAATGAVLLAAWAFLRKKKASAAPPASPA